MTPGADFRQHAICGKSKSKLWVFAYVEHRRNLRNAWEIMLKHSFGKEWRPPDEDFR